MKNERINYSISDTRAYLSSLIETEIPRHKYSNYEIIKFAEINQLPCNLEKLTTKNKTSIVEHNAEAIIGVPPAISYADSFLGDFNRPQFEHKVIFNKNLFFEVLNIAKNVNIELPFDESSICNNDILNLITKYGFDTNMYSGKSFEEMLSESDRIDLFNKPEIREFGFVEGLIIKDFKKQIYELKRRFSIYYGIVNDDKQFLMNILEKDIIFAEKWLPPITPNNKITQNNIIEFAKDALINVFNDYSFSIVLYHEKKLGTFKFKFTAKNLIEACNLFLSQILTMDLNYTKSNIKICANPECGRTFEGHKNKKYCDLCNRKTIWSRNNKKQKED